MQQNEAVMRWQNTKVVEQTVTVQIAGAKSYFLEPTKLTIPCKCKNLAQHEKG